MSAGPECTCECSCLEPIICNMADIYRTGIAFYPEDTICPRCKDGEHVYFDEYVDRSRRGTMYYKFPEEKRKR